MSDPNDPSVFTAERIVSKREFKGKTQYLIKWKGFSNRENTWEPIENILDPGLLTSFEKSKKKPNRRSSTRNSTLTESGSQQNGNGVSIAAEPDQVSSSTSVPAEEEDEEEEPEKKPTRESLAQDTETDTEPDTEPDLEIVIQPDSDSSITEQSEVANGRPVAIKSEPEPEIKAETNSNHHQEAELESEPELAPTLEKEKPKDLPILNSPSKIRIPTPVARTSTPVARTSTPVVSAPAAVLTTPTVTTNGIQRSAPLLVPVTVPVPVPAAASPAMVVKAPTPKPTPFPSIKATATKSTPTCTPKSAPHSTPKYVGQYTPKSTGVANSTPKSVANSTPKPVPNSTPKPVPNSTPKSTAVQTPVVSSIVPVRGEKRAHTHQGSKAQAGEPQPKQKRFVVMNTVITDVTVNNQTITISESRTGHGFFKESGKNSVDATTQAQSAP